MLSGILMFVKLMIPRHIMPFICMAKLTGVSDLRDIV